MKPFMTLEQIRERFDHTRLYSWWWQTGVGYKKAGELANKNLDDISTARVIKDLKQIKAVQDAKKKEDNEGICV